MSQSIDTASLRQRYESLTDDALLAIDRDDLVEAAQTCWDAEVIERRLAIQLPGHQPPRPTTIERASRHIPTHPPAKSWLSKLGGWIVHAMIALLGVTALVGLFPWFDSTSEDWSYVRGSLLGFMFAMSLGYLVSALQPSRAARSLWLPGIACIAAGFVPGTPVLSAMEGRLFWDVNDLTGLNWLTYVVPGALLFVYSCGAWCAAWVPLPKLKRPNLLERFQMPASIEIAA